MAIAFGFHLPIARLVAMPSERIDPRVRLFAGAQWYDDLDETSPGMWAAWRITKSLEEVWWKDALEVASDFAAEHRLLQLYRSRFAGIAAASLCEPRAERENRSAADPIWDIANELIVGRYERQHALA